MPARNGARDVAADQVDVAAEAGAGQDHVEDDVGRDQDHHQQRQAEQIGRRDRAEIVRQAVHRAAAGQHQAEAADRDVGRERDDEGVDLEADHQHAVERAGRRAEANASSSVSQGSSSSPDAEPRVAASQAASIAANAITDSTDRSMWPAMMQNDRPIAIRPTKVACCRMLRKMPIWKKLSIVSEKTTRMIARISQTRWSSSGLEQHARGRGPCVRRADPDRHAVPVPPVAPADRLSETGAARQAAVRQPAGAASRAGSASCSSRVRCSAVKLSSDEQVEQDLAVGRRGAPRSPRSSRRPAAGAARRAAADQPRAGADRRPPARLTIAASRSRRAARSRRSTT